MINDPQRRLTTEGIILSRSADFADREYGISLGNSRGGSTRLGIQSPILQQAQANLPLYRPTCMEISVKNDSYNSEYSCNCTCFILYMYA